MKGTGLRRALSGLLTVKNAVSSGRKGVQNLGLVKQLWENHLDTQNQFRSEALSTNKIKSYPFERIKKW